MPLRTRRHANERLVVLVALGVASALCVAAELLREQRYDGYGFRFMLWNLLLAWAPFLLALLTYDRYRRGTPLLRLTPLLVLWLLFLPNAPYILTDFVHLSPAGRAPLWYDGAMVSAFSWTGLLLGFVSLYLVHVVTRDRFGGRAAWCGVAAVLVLVSAGVCLGRFLRWNSWDLLVRPGQRLSDLAAAADPAALVRGAALTFLLTAVLGAAYFSFYVLVGARLEARVTYNR